ncbi:hypothetical protein [Streptomyces sp. NRRL S-1868]|uniref:hypothetical protein n=1 Tax=Streptomyces sp. NRRL S-1868 TaxID=1463892 RepID=UPI0004CC3B23|nr:hypothetical protein [Streptomyces sp. NRRL S-1868]
MVTIRRNWTNRIAAIRAAAKHCRAYDSSTGNMITADPGRAFAAWEANRRASLTEDVPGQQWTVHVHANAFYVLTATAPQQAGRARRRPAAPAPTPVPAAPARSAEEDAVLREVGEYIKDAPGIGANAAAAAASAIAENVHTGTIRQDHLTGALPAATAAVTAKAVADLRSQGLAHEQIRQRLERTRAEARHAGNLARVAAADAMLAAHAGIVADEEARSRPAAGGRLPELEAAGPQDATVPATFAGVPVPGPVRARWDSELADGWRLGVRNAKADPAGESGATG